MPVPIGRPSHVSGTASLAENYTDIHNYYNGMLSITQNIVDTSEIFSTTNKYSNRIILAPLHMSTSY